MKILHILDFDQFMEYLRGLQDYHYEDYHFDRTEFTMCGVRGPVVGYFPGIEKNVPNLHICDTCRLLQFVKNGQ